MSRRWAALLWLGATLATTMLSSPRGAAAAELRHRVGPSETLQEVARNYYGAAWKVVYIVARNNIKSRQNLSGRKFIIPASWTYRVRRGDSLASIAKRYLGGVHRYKALMRFNGLETPSDLEMGATLLMPFHLRHEVSAGQSYARIARRYYRTPSLAPVLMRYNGRSSPALEPGQKVVVPIFDRDTLGVRKRAYTPAGARKNAKASAAGQDTADSANAASAKPSEDAGQAEPSAAVASKTSADTTRSPPSTSRAGDDSEKAAARPAPAEAQAPAKAESKATATTSDKSKVRAAAESASNQERAGTQSATDAEPPPAKAWPVEKLSDAPLGVARAALEAALSKYDQGRFAQACRRLEHLLDNQALAKADLIDVISHLGFCAVAAGDEQAAVDYFDSWLDLEPDLELDPVVVSPKIRRIMNMVRKNSQTGRGEKKD